MQEIFFTCLLQKFLFNENITVIRCVDDLKWVDTKYGDGIIATDIYNAVRHGRCLNESPSRCNWIFEHCGQSDIYNHTLNDVFALQTEYYPGNYMYANVASAVSHYNTTGLDVCTMNNKYKWMVFYAECVDRWYLLKKRVWIIKSLI